MSIIDTAEEAAGGPLVMALKHWKLIAGGIAMLGMLIALGVTRHTLAIRTTQRDTAIQQRDLAIQSSKITLTSLNQVMDILNAKNAESDARAKAFADSVTTDKLNNDAADARQKADTSRQARLQGIADHATANPSCVAPKALTDEMRGL